MILDTINKVLEIILGGAKTTNDCEFTADYVDTQNGSTFAPGGNIGISNGVTLVTAVAAPAAATQRSVRAFTFFNADTVNTTVIVRIFDGTNRRRIITVALTPGQSLVFTPEAGWAILPSTNGQIPGTTTNDNAAAGCVGEYISSNIVSGAGPNAVVSTNVYDITTISLTAGDWDVWATAGVGATGTPSLLFATINTVSATLATLPNNGAGLLDNVAGIAGGGLVLPVGMQRKSLAATTTIYLCARTDFAGGASNLYGFLGARRAR